MRAHPIVPAAVALALLLGGCHSRRSEPLPGPQSAPAHTAATILAVGPVAQRLVQGTHRCGAFAWKHAKWTG